jgi:hypothetical protein
MNEIEMATNLITNLGFPIFCVIALGFFIYKSYSKITDRNIEREDKLYKVLNKTQVQLDKLEEINEGFVKTLEVFTKDNQQIKKDIEVIKEKIMKE